MIRKLNLLSPPNGGQIQAKGELICRLLSVVIDENVSSGSNAAVLDNCRLMSLVLTTRMVTIVTHSKLQSLHAPFRMP